MKEMLERYIQDLEKQSEYCKKEIELREQLKYQSDYELEQIIKVNKYVIELLNKFINTPQEKFNIPSKSIHLYIRYGNNEIYVEFGLNDDLHSKLYNDFCDSYSELFIGNNRIIEGMSYNLSWTPKLNLKNLYYNQEEKIRKCCNEWYQHVLDYIEELNTGISKAMLDAIDVFYEKIVEYSKEGE